MNIDENVKMLNDKIEWQASGLRELDQYYLGEQPAAFLSEDSREALSGSLFKMSVNFPKLVVTSVAERLEIAGFKVNGTKHDGLNSAWIANKMRDASAQAHLDALIYGRSFVTVWSNKAGLPQVTVESPLQMAVLRDPATREVTSAFKRWVDAEGFARGALYTAEKIYMMKGSRVTRPDVYGWDEVTSDGFVSTGWTTEDTIHNPLGVVPVVPVVNRGRLTEVDGRSEMLDVLGLTDALNKIMQDAMVTSETAARPRRWATGLETQYDNDGKPVDPFRDSERTGKMFTAEDPEVKFGQFEATELSAYATMTATITQQIGALSGLPPHYLGLHGDQPASADAIRSAEASLVARCRELQRTFGQAWSDIAGLMIQILDDSEPVDVRVLWESAETRTPAQAADAAVKLIQVGLPLEVVAESTLGLPPEVVEKLREVKAVESSSESIAVAPSKVSEENKKTRKTGVVKGYK